MAAQPQGRHAGLEGIRSLKDEDAIFQAFDSYPWQKDKNFMTGLHAILGEPGQSSFQGSLIDIATHARVFYYNKQIGVSINFMRYQDWLAKRPDYHPPNVLPEEYYRQPETAAPSDGAQLFEWQQAAPKTELYVDRNAADAQASADDGPNYPMGFAEMLKLIQEGKPVPGIRQIPNTIIRDPSVKPIGARAAPKKPWEKADAPSITGDTDIPKTLDSDFPPVDDELQAGTS
ncbi:hypothetical protein BGZ63DRAFT_369939 [Mariannaea sp. PMI_226]|nr:hypothetical protein BGZ63DRAFT_369939 [Mariannaea sp. PMI_226]